jgi:hypothetical protein
MAGDSDARLVHEDDGTIVGGGLSLTGGFGGHSRFSFTSSLAESPVMLEATLLLRGEMDWRFFCCSKRPMRLATLWRGRSSGNGLERE